MKETNLGTELLEPKESENTDNQIKENEKTEVTLPNQENKNIPNENKNLEKTEKMGDEVKFALTIIGRLIMTIYSFHGLFFIYNFIIQYIILFPVVLYEIDSVVGQVFFGLIYVFFAASVSNILVIPTYEFFLFPFLNFKNPLYHLESFARVVNIIENNISKEDESIIKSYNKNVKWINIFLLIIEIAYIFGILLSFGSLPVTKDIVKVIILFIIYLYYMMIFLGYIIISFYLIVKFFQFSKSKNPRCCSILCDILCNEFFFDSFFGQENDKERNIGPLPKINLLSYIFHPLLKKSYNIENISSEDKDKLSKKGFQIRWIKIKNYIRGALFLTSSILTIIYINKDAFSVIIFIAFFFLLIALSTVMNFPVLFRNKKTFGYYSSGKIKYKVQYKMLHPRLVSFIRFLSKIIIILTAIILLGAFIFAKDSNALKDIISKSENVSPPQNQTVDYSSLLLPNLCFSSIHNIPVYLYLPFINDAYYFYKAKKEEFPFFESSLQIKKYRGLFFDDSYEIEVKGNLVEPKEGEDSVKMIQYNVKNSLNEVTILSIKGTTNKKDIYMDFQLYFPSILLNLLSTFSISGNDKELYSFRFMEFSLSIPYRLFSQYTVINGYLEDLKDAYYKHYPSFYKNIIITGHSLGGGLSKLLGRLLNKQAISLSGPGVNAFHSLWGYEGFSENFEISAIDLVPDMDLVPRVEVSGGTVYRIICKKGPFGCHGKELSLCEVLIMCRNPNARIYCEKYADLTMNEINNLEESSNLNYEEEDED